MRLVSVKSRKVDVPNDPDGGYINIKDLSLEEVAQIDSRYFKISDGGVSMENYANRDADFAKACLTGWGNLFDESGRPLKFTPKNIDKASAFVIDVGGEEVRGRIEATHRVDHGLEVVADAQVAKAA